MLPEHNLGEHTPRSNACESTCPVHGDPPLGVWYVLVTKYPIGNDGETVGLFVGINVGFVVLGKIVGFAVGISDKVGMLVGCEVGKADG